MKRKKIKNKYYLDPEAVLDLHGFTKKEAEAELLLFLKESKVKGFKKIKIITGQGWHNQDFQSILKPFVENILEEENYSYSNTKIDDGGAGAIIVNL